MSPFVQEFGGGRNSEFSSECLFHRSLRKKGNLVKKVSGLTGTLQINLATKVITRHEDEAEHESEIVEDAIERIRRIEESLIDKYRHGQGSSGPPVKPDVVLDAGTAIANLKQKAKELEEKWHSLAPRREAEGQKKYDFLWEMVINGLWYAVQDSLTISRETGEPFWPELSAPEARGTRRADSDTPPPSRR